MSLIERIDKALHVVGKRRSELAHGIGITQQSLTNLERRPGSTMKPQNVAYAARWLKCDLYWLCTGEGGDYVAIQTHESPGFSFLATEVARWLDALPDAERDQLFVRIYRLKQGAEEGP